MKQGNKVQIMVTQNTLDHFVLFLKGGNLFLHHGFTSHFTPSLFLSSFDCLSFASILFSIPLLHCQNLVVFYSSCLDLYMFPSLFFLTSVIHHSLIFSFHPVLLHLSILLLDIVLHFFKSSFFLFSHLFLFSCHPLFFPSPLAVSHFQDVAITSLISNESPSIKPDSTFFF